MWHGTGDQYQASIGGDWHVLFDVEEDVDERHLFQCPKDDCQSLGVNMAARWRERLFE